MLLSLSDIGTTAGVLPDPEDDKLSRLYRRNADQHDKSAVIQIGLAHCRPIATNEKCLFLRRSLEHSVLPQSCQEVTHAPPRTRPKRLIIRFKNDPLRTPFD